MNIYKEYESKLDRDKKKLLESFPNSFKFGPMKLGDNFCDHCWSVRIDDKFVGMAWLKPDQITDLVEISFVVDKDFHGRGICKALIEEVQSFCIENHSYGLIAIVHETNDDYKDKVFCLLKKCGFFDEDERSMVWFTREKNRQAHLEMNGKDTLS